jgi:2-phosphosulfolactate phosphatase
MTTILEVLFTPAEFAALARRDLSQSVCVVFDVFRATSTIVTALAHGAAAVIPVAEIADAPVFRQRRPEVLLAGEREGLRIRAEQTGGIDFDLGNSPREFTSARVQGKTIVLSTTNGSRALRACAPARDTLAASFLNLSTTAKYLNEHPASHLLLVCSGTHDEAAYEDILGAGALVDLISERLAGEDIADSAHVAREIYLRNAQQLLAVVDHSRNGRRLMSLPDLRDDVPWCLQRDIYPLVAKLEGQAITKSHS